MPRIKKILPPPELRSVFLRVNSDRMTEAEIQSIRAHFELVRTEHLATSPNAKFNLRFSRNFSDKELLDSYKVTATYDSAVQSVLLGRQLFPFIFPIRRAALARAEKVNAMGGEQ